MRKAASLLALLMLISAMSGNAFAATSWTNVDGNSAWNCAGNWDSGVPNIAGKTNIWKTTVDGPIITTGVVAETLQLDLGHTLDIDGGFLMASDWIIVGYSDTHVGTMNLSGTGHVNQTGNDMTLGFNGTGNLNMTGGELNLANNLYLGNNTSTSTGNLTMDGGKITCDIIYVGSNGIGNVTVNSGDIFISGGSKDLYVGRNSGSVGHVTINGGLVQVDDDIRLGDSGTGHLTITNTGKLTCDVFYAGYNASADASITMSGGEILARECSIGRYGTVDMVMTDGYVQVSNFMYVGQSGDGSLAMTGGEIKIGAYTIDPNTGNVIGGGPLVIGRNDGSTGEVHLGGGKVTAHHIEMQWDGATTANPSLDMTGGTLILTDTATFYSYILASYITALGGDGGFRYDTTTIPGQTIITVGLEGDANDDGVVDAADYIILKRNFGTSGAGVGQGNFTTGDTDVDWTDLSILMDNMSPAGGLVGSTTTPEPCSAMLLVFGAAALLRRRRS